MRYGRHSSITTKLFSSAWDQQSFVSRRIDPLNPRLVTPEWICLPRLGLQSRTHHVQWACSACPSAPLLGFKAKQRRCRNINLLSIAFGAVWDCVLESTKAAADVYAPVSGTILKVNEELKNNPQTVNQKAQAAGWLFQIQLESPEELKILMTEDQYKKLVSS